MQVGDKRGDISGKSGAGGNKRAGGFFFKILINVQLQSLLQYLKLFLSLSLNLLNKH